MVSGRTLVISGSGVTLLLIVALVLPMWPRVTVSSEEGALALLDHDKLSISYVHSIDGLPVEEDLRVNGSELIVERTRLRQFGAGMGHIEGQGHGYSDGEWWVLDGLERHIGQDLHLRVGLPNIDHRLRAGETELHLSRCMAGERVTISAGRVSTLTVLTTPTEIGCTRSPQEE